MKKVFIFCIVAGLNIVLKSQETDSSLKNYDWDENRNRCHLTTDEEQLPKIILLNKSVTEYITENEDFVQYKLEHMIIRVNSDEAIESSNKITLSMFNVIDVINIKARSISKDGKKIELDKNNIKEIQNDEKNNAYKIFAIEGVEKGCEIEYFYVKKCFLSLYGFDILQFSAPVKESYFQLITPDHLVFKIKGYNNAPDAKDTVINNKRIYTAVATNVPDLQEEVYGNYGKSIMRLEYKLAVNLTKSKKEIYTWSDFAQKKIMSLNNLSKKEKSAVEKLYRDLKINDYSKEESKIIAIENFIKSNILLQDVYQDENSTIDNVIKNKFGDIHTISKLYNALFKEAEVKAQFVVTSKRDELPFDGSFESWRFLNNYLFYFTSTDKYLSPEAINFRYPMIPDNLTYTEGVFLKEVNVGELQTAVALVKFIPPLDFSLTSQKIEANIEFANNLEETHMDLTCTLKGYYAVYVQPLYAQIPDDKKELMLENIVKDITKDTKYTKLTAENTELNISPIEKPFIIHAEVNGSSLIERAGNKILFKVGDILGRQMELYQEKKRKLSVELDNNHEFTRIIKIKIPKGYVIKNLNDIIINHDCKMNGVKVFGFESQYSLNDDLITINIYEYYKELACPIENFEEFRQVINAAADFNKVTLILEPK